MALDDNIMTENGSIDEVDVIKLLALREESQRNSALQLVRYFKSEYERLQVLINLGIKYQSKYETLMEVFNLTEHDL